MYRHNPESFEKLVGEVARRTGTQLKAESALSDMKDKDLRKEGFRIITFSIRVI